VFAGISNTDGSIRTRTTSLGTVSRYETRLQVGAPSDHKYSTRTKLVIGIQSRMVLIDGQVRHRTAAKSDDDHLAQSSNVAVPSARRRTNKFRTVSWVRVIAIISVITILILLTNSNMARRTESNDQPIERQTLMTNATIKTARNQERNHEHKCSFRSYPSKRLYGLSSTTQPDFLSKAAYIRGQWPIILNPYMQNDETTISVSKVCIDTTSWEDLTHNSGGKNDGRIRLPFTDGHNPSVVSLSSNPYNSNNKHTRLDPSHLAAARQDLER
jgi:hypothetical protein